MRLREKFLSFSKYILSALFLVCGHSFLFAQQEEASDSTNETMVYLIHADEIRLDRFLNPDAHILRGNVVFRHDSMYMYCDSALFYQDRNMFNAYKNIKAVQGDTLFLYGDSLYYDGEKKMLRVRNNVKLINNSLELVTDKLNYDRAKELAYFFDNGKMYDENNTLSSKYGEYSTKTEMASFYGNVDLVNKDYTLDSDTLLYHTTSKMAVIISPTQIRNQSNLINSKHGFFYTDRKFIILLDRSMLISEDSLRTMTADSIVYNDNEHYAQAFGNILVDDNQNNMGLRGNYLYFCELNDSILVTDMAQAIIAQAPDSMFIHADTFKVVTFFKMDTIADGTLVATDSVLYRQFRGYNKAKGYKSDFQFMADSLVFDSRDTCLSMYKDPIIWSDNLQVLGELVKAYMNDSTLDWINVINQALFVEQTDSGYYNQISSREMKAFFRNGHMWRTDADGNVQVVFYPIDQDQVMIGMNTTSAPNLSAFFTEQRTLEKMKIVGASKGVLYPMDKIPANKKHLSNFAWFSSLRPYSKDDIFRWRTKNDSQKLKVTSTRKAPLPTLKKNNKRKN